MNDHQKDDTTHSETLDRIDYKKGEPLVLIATEIYTGTEDKKYLNLINPKDPRTKFFASAFDFQTEWVDKFKDGGKSMMGIVERYDKNTDVCKVSQCFSKILEELYPLTSLPKTSTFKILYSKKDDLTSSNYYQIKDAFGIQHRFYTNSHLEIGAEVELEVIGNIDSGNGKGHLEFEIPGANDVKRRRPRIQLDNIELNDEESDFGNENNTTEFKSSIVFVPSSSAANIDEQLKTITKTIAGFLNKDGGTIYLGVNDSGKVCGIESDLPHLNDSETDTYKYKNDIDSYQLKIQNTIRKSLGTNSVLSLIDISFDKKHGLTYCTIKIKPCPFPIFVNGTHLYQRMGNQTNLLKNEEITNFYRFKYNINMDVLVMESTTDDDGSSTPEATIPTSVMEAELKSSQPSIKIQQEIFTPWRYLRLYENGQWSWGRKPTKSTQNLVKEIVIPKERSKKDCVLLMCYANGRVDSVKISDVVPNTEDRLYSNGWRPEDNLILTVAAASDELIAFRSEGSDGEEYNKFHRAKDFSQHTRLGNQGNVVVNDRLGGTLRSVTRVPFSCAHQLGGYITQRNPSQFLGYPRSDENRRDSLPLLDSVFAKDTLNK